jgi:hypothetical protein
MKVQVDLLGGMGILRDERGGGATLDASEILMLRSAVGRRDEVNPKELFPYVIGGPERKIFKQGLVRMLSSARQGGVITKTLPRDPRGTLALQGGEGVRMMRALGG